MGGDSVARDCEHERLRIAFAGNGDLYYGAFGTFEHVCNITGSEAVGGLVIDLDDYVAGANSGVIGRGADVGSHDHGVVLAWGNDHADAVVLAALIFAEQGELAGVKEI